MPRQNSLFLSNWISFSLKALELDHLFLLATRTKQHYALPLTVSTYVLSPLLSVGAGNHCILQPLLRTLKNLKHVCRHWGQPEVECISWHIAQHPAPVSLVVAGIGMPVLVNLKLSLSWELSQILYNLDACQSSPAVDTSCLPPLACNLRQPLLSAINKFEGIWNSMIHRGLTNEFRITHNPTIDNSQPLILFASANTTHAFSSVR